jgi:hypothetical protein
MIARLRRGMQCRVAESIAAPHVSTELEQCAHTIQFTLACSKQERWLATVVRQVHVRSLLYLEGNLLRLVVADEQKQH